MSKTKEQRNQEILEEALQEFNLVQSALRDERKQCVEDRRFYSIAGAQWEGPLGLQFENKPKFEVNKIHLAVIRIFNEYRNNRITVKFVPKDGKSNDQLCDTCNGLYRADEQDSCAEEAYDNAFEEGVGGGIGAWRLRAGYEDPEEDYEEDKQQSIWIEPIFDADTSVFWNLGAKRYDKKDAKKCWVLTSYPIEEYKAIWGDDPTTWPKQSYTAYFDWSTPSVVYVAEYYRVEKVNQTTQIYRSVLGDEVEADRDDQEKIDQLLATGYQLSREEKTKGRKIHKYLMTGGKILEDCGFIAGKYIPIVPFYGKRWFVDNIERCMGHVRLAKDAQRLKNMQLSRLGEISALSTVEKPIMTPEEIAGHAVMWSQDNVKNYPYLLKNRATAPDGMPILAPQEYTKVPNIPPAMAALLQITEQDMQDLLGNQQAGEQIRANVSAEAIDLVQNKLDMQTFIYMSNMAKSVKYSGEVWLSMKKDIVVKEKTSLKTIGTQGEIGNVELMRPVLNEQSGEVEHEGDLSSSDLDVYTEVGPSSSSQRNALNKTLISMLPYVQDPSDVQVIEGIILMNLEGEGLSDFRDYFRQKMIRVGAVKPTDEEAQELQAEQANKQPDPQAQFLQASAAQAAADAQAKRTSAILNLAKAEESQAKKEEILSGIGRDDHAQQINTLSTLNGMNAENNPQQPTS